MNTALDHALGIHVLYVVINLSMTGGGVTPLTLEHLRQGSQGSSKISQQTHTIQSTLIKRSKIILITHK